MHVDGFRFDEGVDPRARPERRGHGVPAGDLGDRALRDAGRHQDHRRGVGRRRPLPDRVLPGLPLGGVERQVPRRHPAVPARRRRPGRRRGQPDRRLVRPLPDVRPPADQQHQLHQLPRRVHAERHGVVQREAQRHNGENNNDGVNDNMSWNCGVEGPTDDPGDRGAAQPADQERVRHPHAVARRADVRRGGRDPADAGRQQQRLLPGQRDQLVRLVAPGEARRTCSASSGR